MSKQNRQRFLFAHADIFYAVRKRGKRLHIRIRRQPPESGSFPSLSFETQK